MQKYKIASFSSTMKVIKISQFKNKSKNTKKALIKKIN
jgi:hypothetical protein